MPSESQTQEERKTPALGHNKITKKTQQNKQKRKIFNNKKHVQVCGSL